jgi:16S rRNA (adenine1518-N6/adenine1519-N6)-dimethyltransferase
MNQLTNQNFIKDLFRHYQLKPKDYMGQNFLVDEIALDGIVSAGNLKKTDTVLEIGPGLGVLTQQLAQRAGNVVAIEKDKTLLDILNFNLKGHDNVKVINQDILKVNVSKIIQGPYKVVANIPYYLTSHLFQFFLGQENRPELMVLLVQKEVGERVTAKPGQMSLLAISVQMFADPELVEVVRKDSFWPSPKVDSVILRLTPKKDQPHIDEKSFFRIVKVGFAGKRKQLHNNFKNGLGLKPEEVSEWLEKNQVSGSDRAQDLSLDDWLNLYNTFPKKSHTS